MKQLNEKKIFGSLRIVAGFALLGALASGTFLGWVDVPGDIRSYGAAFGAAAGVYAKFSHLL
ncbi:MAG: hypothetical protein HHJ15_04075 [Rhodoferax sp.]|uniref:hypothetical protein n=1 Tax=Rhodoferax sp. TaxID=50421 RepID=UPI0017DD5134|nr:hypothetical protein [Rhodoferax sp.]NMM19128.1 hypothetical protein [Rhodoferax sp.]